MAEKKIRGAHALAAVGTCFLAFIAYNAGCSLPDRTYINDIDGGGGTNAGGTGAKGGTGGKPGTGGSAVGGSSSSQAGEAGAPPTGGQPGMDRPVPTKGLIVIGGTAIDQSKGEISVIEPVSGKELNKEMLPAATQVAAVAYDGAAKKDVWYVFVGGAFPAAADKLVEIQVRYFDDVANQWITLSKKTQQPPPVPGTVTVLNDRLAYLSHAVVGGSPVSTLTVLDTSNVLSLVPVAYTLDTSAGAAVTLVGTRGTAVDPSTVGGTLDLGLSENCTGSPKVCELHIQPISVGDSIVNGAQHLIASYQGTPLAAAAVTASANEPTLQDVIVLSGVAGDISLYLTQPDSPEAAMPVLASQKATDLVGLAIADCQALGVFTGRSENALYGLPLDFPALKAVPLGREGQLVAYEPFNSDIIATYNPPAGIPADSGIADPEITAITAKAGTTSTNFTISPRTKVWTPPVDVRANAIATRYPVPFACK